MPLSWLVCALPFSDTPRNGCGARFLFPIVFLRASMIRQLYIGKQPNRLSSTMLFELRCEYVLFFVTQALYYSNSGTECNNNPRNCLWYLLVMLRLHFPVVYKSRSATSLDVSSCLFLICWQLTRIFVGKEPRCIFSLCGQLLVSCQYDDDD